MISDIQLLQVSTVFVKLYQYTPNNNYFYSVINFIGVYINTLIIKYTLCVLEVCDFKNKYYFFF